MNGRLYDPELGRMLSPDPYVQVPEYSQNFNRYSYVLNNPLNLTDPTGFNWVTNLFFPAKWMLQNWRTVLVIAVAFALSLCIPGIGMALLGSTLAGTTAFGAGALTVTWGSIAAGAAIGAITGGLSAALNGGNMGDVLRGAVVGGISGALTAGMHGAGGSLVGKAANIAGHGVIGGASNVALGGKFQDGFLSAAASAATATTGLTDPETSRFSMAGRTAIASITGGTASALGGGKFANGAITGAMTHLLNAEATHWHHRLPKGGDLGEWFRSKGLEIDEKEFGIMLSKEDHTSGEGMHGWRNYNKEWRTFMNNNADASADDILSHLDDLESSPKFNKIIARSKAATMSYQAHRSLKYRLIRLTNTTPKAASGALGALTLGALISISSTSPEDVDMFLDSAYIYNKTGSIEHWARAAAAQNIGGEFAFMQYLKSAQ
jgi:hypothetical protein